MTPLEDLKDDKLFLYVMQSGGMDGPLKFGITSKSVESRRDALQTGNPLPIEVIATCFACHGIVDEQNIHRLCAEERMQGEWFKVSLFTTAIYHAIVLQSSGIEMHHHPLYDVMFQLSALRGIQLLKSTPVLSVVQSELVPLEWRLTPWVRRGTVEDHG